MENIKIKLTPGNRTDKSRGRRSAKKNALGQGRKQPPKFAYTFKEPMVGEMNVLYTHNAWWLDKQKLSKLVDAYKFYCTDEQAVLYAGITVGQLKYFQQMHEEFFTIKHNAKQNPSMGAKRLLIPMVLKDKEMAQWWLERTEKNMFGGSDNNRDLYDGIAEQVRKMGDSLRLNNTQNQNGVRE